MIDASRIDRLFKMAKSENRSALIAYLTAGDPSLSFTKKAIHTLAASGVDLIEVGVPFSDPVADGPVLERAAVRALRQGVNLHQVLDSVRSLRAEGISIPVILFTYFNPIFKMGIELFAEQARQSGVDGVLIVDLPIEESTELVPVFRREGLDTVFLVSPLTTAERMKRIDEVSRGFVYYVSRVGVTGVRSQLSDSLDEELELVHQNVSHPVAVGFGVSTPEHVARIARLAEGVVVGSAFVSLIESHLDQPEVALEKLATFAKSLASQIAR